MNTHVMVDLETLGTNPGSVILSLGAVKFTEEGIQDTFYSRISPESCQAVGMRIDASTVKWWLMQSEAARKEVSSPAPDVKSVLEDFAKWLPGFNSLEGIWGCGSNFDNVLLASAYRAAGRPTPWKYSADRCYRTMRQMFPWVDAPQAIGTAHNALDDAKFQTLHLIEIMKNLKSANPLA